MYIRKTTKVSDDYQLIQCHGPGRYGAPGQKRKKREKETPERVKEQNRKNRAEKLQLLILSNFYEHGHHIVLGYPKGEAPGTYEEAERILKRFLEKIQRKMGGRFKYIAATERGKRTAVLHHHMIIQDAPGLMELIEKEWPGKRVHSTATYEDDTCGRQLADYIVKSIDKDKQGTYHISRNLAKPEVKRELIIGRMEEPTAPQGYQIVPDTLYIGINRFTGWQYQRYFIRLNIKETDRFPEWNRDSSKNENPKTLPEAARETFNKVVKSAVQNGNGLFGIVDNLKTSNGMAKKYHPKKEKSAVQNGKAPFRVMDNSVENKNTGKSPILGGRKNDFQNGNGLLGIVDKLKARFGAGKKYIETDRKPAIQNGNAPSRGADDRDELAHCDEYTKK